MVAIPHGVSLEHAVKLAELVSRRERGPATAQHLPMAEVIVQVLERHPNKAVAT